MTTDVVICNLPKMLGSYLPAAPAILKSVCNYLHLPSKVLDLNLDFLSACQSNGVEMQKLIGILDGSTKDQELQNLIDDLVDSWVDKITVLNPKVIAISLFSYYAQGFARPLISALRHKSKAKIVIGGAGIKISINDVPAFAQELKESDQIDHYIVDDGEVDFFEYLKQCFHLDIAPITDAIEKPFLPDYSDYDIDSYLAWAQHTPDKRIMVPVVGSKGCVRQCDFCEIHQHWKFQQKSAEHLEKEIITILDLVDNPHIHFTDSLVNGSLSEFRRIVKMMQTLRQNHKFTWGGQFIVRESNQFDEEDWRDLAASSFSLAEVGLETGSEILRHQMNKKFSNDAVNFMLQMMDKYGVKCVFLMMVGHPHETEDDFKKTVDMLKHYASYSNKVISSLQLGYAVAVQPGTPLYDNSKELRIMTTKNPVIWMNQNNPTLTYSERLKRRQYLSNVAKDLGYTLAFDEDIAVGEYQHNQEVFAKHIKIMESMIKKPTSSSMIL